MRTGEGNSQRQKADELISSKVNHFASTASVSPSPLLPPHGDFQLLGSTAHLPRQTVLRCNVDALEIGAHEALGQYGIRRQVHGSRRCPPHERQGWVLLRQIRCGEFMPQSLLQKPKLPHDAVLSIAPPLDERQLVAAGPKEAAVLLSL
eukprot:scaffold4863_cov158-Pinguiococcus_pyrenoidosus.AAC.2